MDICPDMIKFNSCKSSQLESLMAQTIIMSLENFHYFSIFLANEFCESVRKTYEALVISISMHYYHHALQLYSAFETLTQFQDLECKRNLPYKMHALTLAQR